MISNTSSDTNEIKIQNPDIKTLEYAEQLGGSPRASTEGGCIHIAAPTSCGHRECLTDDELKAKRARHSLVRVSVLCFFFMCVELAGGYFSNSLAIMTDAAHLLSDLASFIISIVAIFISRKAPTSSYSFGFYRAEILGALISVMLIWLLTIFLITEAIERMKNPSSIDGKMMFIVASLGIIVNIAMGLVLMKSGHGHSHGGIPSSNHNHNDTTNTTVQYVKDTNNHNITITDDNDTKIIKTKDKLTTRIPSTDTLPLTEYSKKVNNTTHISPDNTTVITRLNRTENSPLLDDDINRSRILTNSNTINDNSNKGNTIVDTDMNEINDDNHGHNHSESSYFGDINTNVRAALIHIIGDAQQSAGVLIAASQIWWKPDWLIVDPICTLIFSVIVVFTTTRIFRDGIMVLMEGVPSHLNQNDILNELRSIPGVIRVHDLHIWSLSIGNPALSVHIIVDSVAKENILRISNAILSKRFNINHSTIQIESPNDTITCNTNAPRLCQRNTNYGDMNQ